MEDAFPRILAAETPQARQSQASVYSEYVFNSCLLLVVDLNGVELLPGLLEYERALRPMAELPQESDSSAHSGSRRPDGRYPIPGAYSPLISAISAILYQEGSAVPSGSELHLLYRASKNSAGNPPPLRRLTPERRDQIIVWAEDFLATVPPSEWLRGEGMIPEPVSR